jgi:EAL domain-containing protein (putative c-di-GMP-specific phosphodiesterase class I)
VRAPVDLGGRRLLTHASAGVAMGAAGSSVSDLMRDADIAMYHAKTLGKDRVAAYAPAMHTEVVRGYELRTELAAAVASGGLVLRYRPVADLASDAIVGANTIVHWQHPTRGLLGPEAFMSVAETSGLNAALGRWTVREACTAAASWPRGADGRRHAVSVDLSASRLVDPALVDSVAAVLTETGLPPDMLVLQVTESALVDIELARASLTRLRGLGVRLALADFGIGYSALSYLAELPFDIVKLDRSFIARIGHDRRVDALLEGILGLCVALDLVTVAEGVDESGQLERLRQLGCRFGEGDLIGRPIAAAAFHAALGATRTPERRHGSVGGDVRVARRAPAGAG